LAVLAAGVLLAGCVTGGQSARIREIKAEGATGCKYLGVAETSERTGWSMSDDELGAMPAIRRRVSELGGNAFVVTHSKLSGFGPTVRADVYRCP
jgi:hypothetical protein